MPQMRCLTPVALRLPGLQFRSPAKRSAAGFFLVTLRLLGLRLNASPNHSAGR